MWHGGIVFCHHGMPAVSCTSTKGAGTQMWYLVPMHWEAGVAGQCGLPDGFSAHGKQLGETKALH